MTYRIYLVKITLLAIGLLLCFQMAFAKTDDFRFAEKVNIALRRTAHHLLVLNADSTTTIQPVQQKDPNTFSIRVENLLTYEKLPELLQQSLQMQHIERGYNVAVLRCDSPIIQLGYNFLDLNQEGGVPCQNRAQEGGCYTLQISFVPENSAAVGGFSSWWMLPFGSALAGLGFMAWTRSRQKGLAKTTSESTKPTLTPGLKFGNSSLDLPGQILQCGSTIHQLTYREAKLLSLFVRNPNQVLERDFILKSVWEDEGIIVGRSVDVFVSRLRKMLSNDATIKIAAVHGVGYKMEVLL